MGQKPDRNGIRKEWEKRNWRQLFGGYVDSMLWVQRNGTVTGRECSEKMVCYFFLRWEKLQQVCCMVMRIIQYKGKCRTNMRKVARAISLNITQIERLAF